MSTAPQCGVCVQPCGSNPPHHDIQFAHADVIWHVRLPAVPVHFSEVIVQLWLLWIPYSHTHMHILGILPLRGYTMVITLLNSNHRSWMLTLTFTPFLTINPNFDACKKKSIHLLGTGTIVSWFLDLTNIEKKTTLKTVTPHLHYPPSRLFCSCSQDFHTNVFFLNFPARL